MAGEAIDRSYRYLPILSHDQALAQMNALFEEDLDKLQELQEATRHRPPRFFHNDLHDLESMWWTAIWKLFTSDRSEFVGDGISFSNRATKRRQAFSNIFRASSGLRWSFFDNGNMYERETSWMPQDLRLIRRLLRNLREILVFYYKRFEAEFPAVQMGILDEVHEKVLLHFDACRCSMDKIRDSLQGGTKSRHSLSPNRNNDRFVQERSIPSLKEDSGSSGDSSSDFEFVDFTHSQSDPSERVECADQKQQPDISMPLPLLRASRYALQHCSTITY